MGFEVEGAVPSSGKFLTDTLGGWTCFAPLSALSPSLPLSLSFFLFRDFPPLLPAGGAGTDALPSAPLLGAADVLAMTSLPLPATNAAPGSFAFRLAAEDVMDDNAAVRATSVDDDSVFPFFLLRLIPNERRWSRRGVVVGATEGTSGSALRYHR